MSSDFPRGEPMSPVEDDLRNAWRIAIQRHEASPTEETWQRRVAATGAYKAVYDWNRSK